MEDARTGRNVVGDILPQNSLSLTGGHPTPEVVLMQDEVVEVAEPESEFKPEPETYPNSGNNSEKTRYSDEELAEFRDIILGRLETAQKLYEFYSGSVRGTDSNDTSDTSPEVIRVGEAGSNDEKEKNTKFANDQKRLIENLNAALVRVENKSYGICRETGKLISKERLRAVPHATLSIAAKNNQK